MQRQVGRGVGNAKVQNGNTLAFGMEGVKLGKVLRMRLDQQAGPAVMLKTRQEGKPGLAVARADLKDEDLPLVAVMHCIQQHREQGRDKLGGSFRANGPKVADHAAPRRLS